MPLYSQPKQKSGNPLIHQPIALFTPKQVYAIEQAWFENDNISYSLMQQAAWQTAHWVNHNIKVAAYPILNSEGLPRVATFSGLKVCVWVGSGNNGGDGWLVAHYLQQFGAKVSVIEVGQAATEDAKAAKKQALQDGIPVYLFSEGQYEEVIREAQVYIDALFGIGLDRIPANDYAEAVKIINERKRNRQGTLNGLQVISIDVPSGLVASTGQVFDGCAVKADTTLCLVARKLGLHIKDGADYSGQVIDIALIPSVLKESPTAWLQQYASPLIERENNTHKGSFGHALIIGGNQIDGSQGMGGAAILSASTAFATGVGKVTVACHKTFHASLIASVPNAMSLDLHSNDAVNNLIGQCDVVAIGMGLGRDDLSFNLFETYLQQTIAKDRNLIIDADGLYHLAALDDKNPQLLKQLIEHAKQKEVYYTPHSGEAARLLAVEPDKVEADRFQAICSLIHKYQGSWLLKGAGSIIMTEQQAYVCAAGNPGMATAGMGDVLSGLAAGLLAQTSLPTSSRSLQQAVMIHALAGDKLQQVKGSWAVQAHDMPLVVGEVFKELTLQ